LRYVQSRCRNGMAPRPLVQLTGLRFLPYPIDIDVKRHSEAA